MGYKKILVLSLICINTLSLYACKNSDIIKSKNTSNDVFKLVKKLDYDGLMKEIIKIEEKYKEIEKMLFWFKNEVEIELDNIKIESYKIAINKDNQIVYAKIIIDNETHNVRELFFHDDFVYIKEERYNNDKLQIYPKEDFVLKYNGSGALNNYSYKLNYKTEKLEKIDEETTESLDFVIDFIKNISSQNMFEEKYILDYEKIKKRMDNEIKLFYNEQERYNHKYIVDSEEPREKTGNYVSFLDNEIVAMSDISYEALYTAYNKYHLDKEFTYLI